MTIFFLIVLKIHEMSWFEPADLHPLGIKNGRIPSLVLYRSKEEQTGVSNWELSTSKIGRLDYFLDYGFQSLPKVIENKKKMCSSIGLSLGQI